MPNRQRRAPAVPAVAVLGAVLLVGLPAAPASAAAASHVSARLSANGVHPGASVTVTGRATPGAGRVVSLQQRGGSGWATVRSTRHRSQRQLLPPGRLHLDRVELLPGPPRQGRGGGRCGQPRVHLHGDRAREQPGRHLPLRLVHQPGPVGPVPHRRLPGQHHPGHQGCALRRPGSHGPGQPRLGPPPHLPGQHPHRPHRPERRQLPGGHRHRGRLGPARPDRRDPEERQGDRHRRRLLAQLVAERPDLQPDGHRDGAAQHEVQHPRRRLRRRADHRLARHPGAAADARDRARGRPEPRPGQQPADVSHDDPQAGRVRCRRRRGAAQGRPPLRLLPGQPARRAVSRPARRAVDRSAGCTGAGPAGGREDRSVRGLPPSPTDPASVRVRRAGPGLARHVVPVRARRRPGTPGRGRS